MRKPRDFRPQQLYAVTQRGNGGQWIHRDAQDFEQALIFMRKYTALNGVRIHGFALMHNHGHWIFEASTEDSISNVMRDMQSRFSHYLNVKYRDTPWVLIAPLFGCKNIDHFAPYLRTGPVNWTPRFDARHLDAKGFREFLRYLENNPVRAGLAERAIDWPWSSAKAHCTGHDADNLLTFDLWQHIFGNPDNIACDWQTYLEGPLDEVRQNAARNRGLHSGCPPESPAGLVQLQSAAWLTWPTAACLPVAFVTRPPLSEPRHILARLLRLSTLLPSLVRSLPSLAQSVPLCLAFRQGRGRDEHRCPPPAQIRTSGTTAYGSYLGYLASKRTSG